MSYSERSDNNEAQLSRSLSMLDITQQEERKSSSPSIEMDYQEQEPLQMAAQSNNYEEVDKEEPNLENASCAAASATPAAPPLDVDPEVLPPALRGMTKQQLTLLCDSWFMHITQTQCNQNNLANKLHQIEIEFDNIDSDNDCANGYAVLNLDMPQQTLKRQPKEE
ncbi:hypothetical protein SFRURICE_003504 [Spodoptera frugiperda]|nr:hypothetical protein SFRURICE_003504 [Spodoptera frugiperda]